MANHSPAPTGLLDTLRALGDSLLGSLHDRLELISVEVQEEKHRLIRTFIWISAAIFAGMMAAAFASLTLVVYFWDTNRVTALGGLALLYAGAGGAVILALRRHLARQPGPFAATLAELREDRACIQAEK
jgi:uncharacterized membrane protein YqjE